MGCKLRTPNHYLLECAILTIAGMGWIKIRDDQTHTSHQSIWLKYDLLLDDGYGFTG